MGIEGSGHGMSGEKRVTIRRDTSGATKVFIDALINDRGDLVLEGQDVGAAPLQIFGDSDYEYWVTVPADQKEEVLLGLMKEVFGQSERASSDFMAWLKERGIQFKFSSY